MKDTTHSSMMQLISFLKELEQAKIAYRLDSVREAIMVMVTVPGERWEIEYFPDGEVEIERFISTGKIEDTTALADLFARFTD